MQTFVIVFVLIVLLLLISVVSYEIYKTVKSSPNVVVVKLDKDALKLDANSDSSTAEPAKEKPSVSIANMPSPPPPTNIAKDQFNTLSYIYAEPPPLPYPGYVFPPAGYPYPFSYNSKQLGGGYYYHGDGRRRR